ncbi:hypothetical protein DY000_02055277 [Brassica cretica]|uniref:Uncharacterized protein n=1 Tax=Brassica cretica TaxID=69181 RepID=A0ABQ7AHE3_BRACR|nr:hypothetical protein DY000_02055277 [Brassica cretica]
MQPTYLELYNARTDVLNTRINEPLGLVTAMTFTNGMLFVGTSRGRISLWKDEEDLYTYNPQPFRLHMSYVALTKVGTVNLYIYNDGRFIRRGSLYSLATVDILLFDAQNLLFTGGKNDTFRTWRRNVFG